MTTQKSSTERMFDKRAIRTSRPETIQTIRKPNVSLGKKVSSLAEKLVERSKRYRKIEIRIKMVKRY